MRLISYEEAALLIGCDHHYVRMLTSRGRFTIVDREEVRPNVLKVYIDRSEVERYIEQRRHRETIKIRVTSDEEEVVKEALARYRREHQDG